MVLHLARFVLIAVNCVMIEFDESAPKIPPFIFDELGIDRLIVIAPLKYDECDFSSRT